MGFEMNEVWKVYGNDIIPIDNYEVIYVSQGCEGTKIVLEGNNYNLKIRFWSVDSLRATDEGRRIRTYHEVESIQDYRKDFIGLPIFTVDNSEFIAWVAKESAGIYTDSIHYAIMTINDIVDIVAPFPPEIIVRTIID